MTLEVAIIDIQQGCKAQFESAFLKAEKILASAGGYLSHDLQNSVEHPNRYVLLVNWRSLEDHTTGFRESEQFLQWRALLGGFFESAPAVEHYEAIC